MAYWSIPIALRRSFLAKLSVISFRIDINFIRAFTPTSGFFAHSAGRLWYRRRHGRALTGHS